MIPISDTTDVGRAIRNARKQLNLTQPQLALATGVGVRFIVDLEAGKPTVQLALVLRVIEALGGQVALAGLPESPVDGTDATDQKNKRKETESDQIHKDVPGSSK
jgi:y4mF family transcriptional regulator